VEWTINDEVRGVSFEFGFDPKAFNRGQGSGAGLSLELVNDQGAQTLYHRFLDPGHHAEDRQT
jgi:hypothetical protein